MDVEFGVLLRNFPSMLTNTGQWLYGWDGADFLEKREASGVRVRWLGYIPPQPEIDDIIGMDDPNG